MHRRYQPTSRLKGGQVARIVRDDYRKDTGEWTLIRLRVLTRDGYRCRRCGCSVKGTNKRAVHHILELSKGGRTVESNLITLCEPCHERGHRHMATPSISRPKVFKAKSFKGGRR